jgi:hypothetical protein
MHLQGVTVAVLISSLSLVQALSIGGLQNKAVDSPIAARDGGIVDYLQLRQEKKERRRALRQREPQFGGGNGQNFGGGNGQNFGGKNNAAQNGNGNNNNNNNNAAAAKTLNANAIQTGSAQTGQAGNAVTAGQVNSAT